jgi:cholesterol transport system auxiliary component
VVAPRVAPGLDTVRIAVLDAPNHLIYYNSVAWADNLPEVLQRFWLDAFNQWGAFSSVGSDMDSAYSDFMLFTDIYEFQLSAQEEPPSVHLRMTARLVNAKTNKVLINIPVEESAAVETVQMDNIVRAFNLSLDKATATIMEKLRPCSL